MWTIIVIFLFSPPPVVWWQMLWLRTARDGDINQVVLGGVTNRHSGEELYQHCDANCNRSNNNHNYLLQWSSDTPTPEPQPLTSLIWAISEGISVKMLKCVEVSWYWYRSTLSVCWKVKLSPLCLSDSWKLSTSFNQHTEQNWIKWNII